MVSYWQKLLIDTLSVLLFKEGEESGLIAQILEHRLVELPWLIIWVIVLLRGWLALS